MIMNGLCPGELPVKTYHTHNCEYTDKPLRGRPLLRRGKVPFSIQMCILMQPIGTATSKLVKKTILAKNYGKVFVYKGLAPLSAIA